MILQGESPLPRASGHLAAAFAGCLALALLPLSATAAPSPDAIGAALVAAVAATGEATLAYTGASAAGDTVTLSGVTITSAAPAAAPATAQSAAADLAAAADRPSIAIPALVFTGAASRTGGGFSVAHLALDNGSVTARGEKLTWATASLDDVVIPSAAEVTARAKVQPFDKFAAAGINLSGAHLAAPITVAAVSGSVGDLTGTAPAAIHAEAHGVKLDTALLADSYFGAIITMLDYSTVTADVVFDGAWDTTADSLTLTSLSIAAPDMGKVTVSGKVSGFSVRGLADPARAKEARAAARLDGVTLRLDNAGFIEHMLDMQASMLGGTRDDVRNQLTGSALPFFLGFVKNAAFRDATQKAVADFLADPHSLTITSAAPTPVPLGEAMRAALHSPATIPDLLGLSVTANN